MNEIYLAILVCIFTYFWNQTKDQLHLTIESTMTRSQDINDDEKISKNYFISYTVSWQAAVILYKVFVVSCAWCIIVNMFRYVIKWTNKKKSNSEDDITLDDINLGFLFDLVTDFCFGALMSFIVLNIVQVFIITYDYLYVLKRESWNKNNMHVHTDVNMIVLYIVYFLTILILYYQHSSKK